MCTSPFCRWGGGRGRGEPLTKGGLDMISIFRGELLGKRGMTFFRGCNFYIKNKLKSDIFNGI